jgi:hypothetical protein
MSEEQCASLLAKLFREIAFVSKRDTRRDTQQGETHPFDSKDYSLNLEFLQ